MSILKQEFINKVAQAEQSKKTLKSEIEELKREYNTSDYKDVIKDILQKKEKELLNVDKNIDDKASDKEKEIRHKFIQEQNFTRLVYRIIKNGKCSYSDLIYIIEDIIQVDSNDTELKQALKTLFKKGYIISEKKDRKTYVNCNFANSVKYTVTIYKVIK